jgi:hypothetical protein
VLVDRQSLRKELLKIERPRILQIRRLLEVAILEETAQIVIKQLVQLEQVEFQKMLALLAK